MAGSGLTVDAYTHVVVGAGSAGCALAARLSEEPDFRVLLIEAGGRDWNPMLHIPLGSGKLLRRGLHGWKYRTEPAPETMNRAIHWPRGRVLGGSSSINGMVYMRGAPADYDLWAQAGNRGWSFADVLPYFKRSEGHKDRNGALHGTRGPLAVTRGRSPNPLYEAFLRAGAEAGYGRVDDFNGPDQTGFGRYDFTIHRGRRASAATAFLAPARARANLAVATRAQVLRVVVEGGRATGVEYLRRGQRVTAQAEAEVILAAGTTNSPQILMLSGIGDPEELAAHDIPVVQALPGVGKNLQDHLFVGLRYACPLPVTLHSLIRFDRAGLAMAQAALLRSGPATSFPTEGGAFTRTRPELAEPDLQWHCTIGLGGSRIRVPYLHPWRPTEIDQDGFTLGVYLLRPHSRGEVRLRSADPLAAPRLMPNYLRARADLETLRRGVAQIREVAAQPSLKPFISAELAPGPGTVSPDAVEAWIRASAESAHHQVGTCRMGSDPLAVVDERLRVHGVEGLRVADASIMPTIVGGNTNAPAIMIGEKAADLVRGREAVREAA